MATGAAIFAAAAFSAVAVFSCTAWDDNSFAREASALAAIPGLLLGAIIGYVVWLATTKRSERSVSSHTDTDQKPDT